MFWIILGGDEYYYSISNDGTCEIHEFYFSDEVVESQVQI